MSNKGHDQIAQRLSNPGSILIFLADVRRGLALRPSDHDILQALESLPPNAPLEAVRGSAQALAERRIHRRRVVAARQQRRLMANLRDYW
jgi:hypothetical protein